jgi:Concanavalin A-like lectin/glucanases superfamily/PQQ enzyme repeat
LKTVFSISSLIAAGVWSAVVSTNAQVNVTQYHNHSSRDGLYIDGAFTPSAAANLTRDLNFDGTIVGNVLTQPLYLDNGAGGRPTIIAVAESNNVYALDAVSGSIIWQRNVGPPVPADQIHCTEVGSAGIIGTPVVHLASRALFLNALTTPDGGRTKKHYIISLNVDTGAINSGWPVDVEATAQYNGTTFIPATQMQSAALAIVGNILYVGYGSHADCSLYHGWLVGVPINNPASVTAWATSAIGGGIWSAGGVASDGTNPFVATGNTYQPPNWSGGEAVIRFQPGPIFSGNSSDYWVPLNWSTLDQQTTDLGASGPLLLDVPGATPSHLVVQMGKDEYAHLLNRANLGGITAPIAEARVAYSYIYGGPATYRTNQGTYVAFRAGRDALKTFRITATSPPTIASGWVVYRGTGGCGSPWVTSTDGTNNMIVWVVGTGNKYGNGGDQRLHGYNGNTGAVVYGGGGANELMAGTHTWRNTGIVARGRIYIATDNKVYAFKLPGGTPTPTPTPTTTATPTPGLVAAYGFNEGSGMVVNDASGNGNNGTISGATWTTSGKYGNALNFNGTNARVTINNAPSLQLTSAMTLEAWVYPTTVNSAWRDVIYKGNDNYYLEGTSPNSSRPAMGGTFAGDLYGTSPLTANTWSHLAATYDGATIRLYVNGVQVASRAQTGAIATSMNPLQIGGDSIYGQYFAGRIDEVRIYNRALSVTEIQSDMNTPL